jgi:hypothetical protein
MKANAIAGGLVSKYWRIRLEKRLIAAHRIAWLITYGEWPKDDIDHINGDPLDNRIENLRACTRSQNCQNKRKPTGENPYLGVTAFGDKWRAQIKGRGNKNRHLGLFATPEEARDAYIKAKRKEHSHGTL